MAERKAIVIGGGVAGLQAASSLAADGADVVLLEKEPELGGRLRKAHLTFPDLEPSWHYLGTLIAKAESNIRIRIMTGTEAVAVRKEGAFVVMARSGANDRPFALFADAVVVTSGMQLVDAAAITEFGLGKYEDVVTSERFEEMLASDERPRRPSDGSLAKTIAFIQCVGSRVEKRGVPYCSAVCCTEAIKQAMLVRISDYSTSTYVLYIDIRTTGRGCEALYKRARREGVRFVRGQPSMVLKRPGSDKLIVCGENTLQKELYEIPADIVVLSVGLELGEGTKALLIGAGAELDDEGLPRCGAGGNCTSTTVPGLFVAGCAESPKDIPAAMAQGSDAAVAAIAFLASKG